jgi:hypothetical protein
LKHRDCPPPGGDPESAHRARRAQLRPPGRRAASLPGRSRSARGSGQRHRPTASRAERPRAADGPSKAWRLPGQRPRAEALAGSGDSGEEGGVMACQGHEYNLQRHVRTSRHIQERKTMTARARARRRDAMHATACVAAEGSAVRPHRRSAPSRPAPVQRTESAGHVLVGFAGRRRP